MMRGIGNWLAPARFIGFIAVLVASFAALRLTMPAGTWQDAAAMAFDVAAGAFLLSLIPLLRDVSAEAMRIHSRANDTNRELVLIVTTVLGLVVLAAIGGELRGAQAGDMAAIVKLVATLALTWLFANSVYALHYAHHYYQDQGGHDQGGIDFPGTKTPGYIDFAYFAFTLGMTFQTSDVAVTQTRVRAVVILHTAAAFVFNIGIIAFTINALGGG